ncbi:oocyte zinc finger protein XlCOF26 [Folsomia candida]|uniref:Zinc finger protein 26 n=1 Tax=Folsomia candida TaxID=158441 RepID=A0A226DQZ0_FOLCA|nr:oocyte zinc finger protein XlCOF26 [Folsomia candida]OXA47264.1 Zinc finger protein 26 [Folsomia candida]
MYMSVLCIKIKTITMPKKNWQCPQCSKMCNTRDHLQTHFATQHPDAKMKCKVCGNNLKSPQSLSNHIRNYHTNRKLPTCQICRRVFFSSATLRGHMNAAHTTAARPRVRCTFPRCTKTYSSQNSLSNHVRGEHAQNPVRLRCKLCGREFKTRGCLEKHISYHTTEKPYKCATCGRCFARGEHLKIHEETHLEKSRRKIFHCGICPTTFVTKAGWKRHIVSSHGNQRDYRCAVCGKRFALQSYLKRHVENKHPVDEEKIHSCKKCEYKSHSKAYLANHVKRHNIANYKHCDFCSKAFAIFPDLAKHFGRHTLEKYVNRRVA